MKIEVGTLIAPDGTVTVLSPTDGRQFTLQECQKAVDGYVELHVMGNYTIYLNEDGRWMRLAANPKATAILLRHRPNLGILGQVLGPVFIIGPNAYPVEEQ